MSKEQQTETYDFMLRCGVSRILLGTGDDFHVVSVGEYCFQGRFGDGSIHDFHVDINKPQQPRLEQWLRWRKQLLRRQRTSAVIRVFGHETVADGHSD